MFGIPMRVSSVADLKGDARDAPHPQYWSNSMLAPPLGLVSPPVGNPGSATDLVPVVF